MLVPINNLVQIEIIESNRRPLLMFPYVHCFSFRDCWYPLLVWHSHLAASRDLGSPPLARRPQEVSARPTSCELCGPTALGLAVAHLVAMALGVAYRQARNGYRLAPQRIRLYWIWKSGRGTPGRPEVCEEVRELIRKMRMANPLRDGVLNAVEGCAAVHCYFTPPPAGWLAAIDRGSLSRPTDLDTP
jgi:hypothetical protein